MSTYKNAPSASNTRGAVTDPQTIKFKDSAMNNHSKTTPTKHSDPLTARSLLIDTLREPVTYITFIVLLSLHIIEWLRGVA